jgi:hypothetical protein
MADFILRPLPPATMIQYFFTSLYYRRGPHGASSLLIISSFHVQITLDALLRVLANSSGCTLNFVTFM